MGDAAGVFEKGAAASGYAPDGEAAEDEVGEGRVALAESKGRPNY